MKRLLNFRVDMKKSALSIILLVSCLTISGQQINQSNNHYRSGDILGKKQVSVEDFDLNGKNCVWSLEDADIFKKSFNIEYTAETDTMTMLERGNRTYYRHENGLVSIIGSENVQTLISYDMPETWLQFPMQQGDSVCGYFNGTGKYCDRLFMRRFGTYLTKADARGEIVLPDGDTLRHVLRLHTERYISTLYAPIDTMKREIPAFTTDSIIRHMATDTMMVREDVYRWYADGYRYPVLEATIVSHGDQKLSEELFYYAPGAQELLVLDEENKKTRERLATANTEYGNDNGNGDERDFTYHVSQDEGSETITISYSSEKSEKVSALLANSQGYVFRQASQTDGSALSLSYSGLRRGQYILRIVAGTHQFAEKFNFKK